MGLLQLYLFTFNFLHVPCGLDETLYRECPKMSYVTVPSENWPTDDFFCRNFSNFFCPIWMKFGIRVHHLLLFSLYELCDNPPREGCAFLMGINEIKGIQALYRGGEKTYGSCESKERHIEPCSLRLGTTSYALLLAISTFNRSNDVAVPKVNMPISLINRPHFKAYGRVDVQLHTFLTGALRRFDARSKKYETFGAVDCNLEGSVTAFQQSCLSSAVRQFVTQSVHQQSYDGV